MEKLKIYLDTSVISHLDQRDAPDKTKDTQKLWEEIKQGKYEAYVSERVFAEIADADEPKQSEMLAQLAEIEHNVLPLTEEVAEYARRLCSENIISDKHFDDCLHIAYAAVNNCDMIVSWNFKHIVRAKTINGARYVNSALGYKDIGIYAPNMIIEGDENE